MPSTEQIDRQEAVNGLVRRYLIAERSLRVALISIILFIFFAIYVRTSIFLSVIVAAGMVVCIRLPIIKPRGTVQLETDLNADTVAASFSGDMPPMLAFQWGLADEIYSEGTVTKYKISYLFGTQTVEMAINTRAIVTPEQAYQVEIDVSGEEKPWAQYQVVTRQGAERRVIEYKYEAARRFSVLRLFQRIIANRYRDDVLAVQGYTLRNRQDNYVVID